MKFFIIRDNMFHVSIRQPIHLVLFVFGNRQLRRKELYEKILKNKIAYYFGKKLFLKFCVPYFLSRILPSKHRIQINIPFLFFDIINIPFQSIECVYNSNMKEESPIIKHQTSKVKQKRTTFSIRSTFILT